MTMDMKLSNEQVIFGLDIGTRSVVGIVGYKTVGNFTVIGEYTQLHETRSMIDGQIHDVNRVAATIKKVKDQLEKQIGFKLKDVSIAAAGRVLKTCQVRIEEAVDRNTLINQDRIYALELLGMEKAHQEIKEITKDQVTDYHCVGYTVSKYYLNDYEISHLEGHKGGKIAADVLATFLPKEVVESLYQVVDQADLSVRNLTLEPIAAIDVAIPPNYRLLNIALVDIGAGTSDIAITKEGSIVAYGMIPVAGDELTEKLVHKYLIDFKTAEKVKIKSAGRAKTMSFKDIMGMKHKIEMDDVRKTLEPAASRLAKEIADKIVSLNGQSTNAVFVVGGGGQLKGFDKILAKQLNISKDRVAIRGKEVLDMVTFETDTKLGPEMVTPIGICYSAMERGKHDFIQVFFNDEPIKVFNSNKITVMDIAAFKGYDPRKLLVSRGEDLIYSLDGEDKIIKGEAGQVPMIMINNEEASMSSPVQMNDYITIVDAKKGEKGSLSTNQLLKNIEAFTISINNERYKIQPKIMVNNEIVARNRDLVTGDQVKVVGPTINEVFVTHDIDYNNTDIYVNGPKKALNDVVNDHDIIMFDAFIKKEPVKQEEQVVDKPAEVEKETKTSAVSNDYKIVVVVNEAPVIMTGKQSYVFADVFDFIDFDRTQAKGNLICKVNGSKFGYLDPINDKDIIEIYWKNGEA